MGLQGRNTRLRFDAWSTGLDTMTGRATSSLGEIGGSPTNEEEIGVTLGKISECCDDII